MKPRQTLTQFHNVLFQDIHKFVLSISATGSSLEWRPSQERFNIDHLQLLSFCFSAHGVPGARVLPPGPGSFGDVSVNILLFQRHIGRVPVHCSRYHTLF